MCVRACVASIRMCMHTWCWVKSLPVYQVRVDWLSLPCVALIQPSHWATYVGNSVVEHLPSKQYGVGLNLTRAALFSFSMEKEMFRLVVLPCSDLHVCKFNSFHVCVGGWLGGCGGWGWGVWGWGLVWVWVWVWVQILILQVYPVYQG